MKRNVLNLVLLATLCLMPCTALAEDPPVKSEVEKAYNPIEQFTGKYWMDSTQVNKEAYLFGIESAIAVDYFITKEEEKSRKKPVSYLSKFETGWMDAFKDVPRQQIVTEIDNWYKANPDQLNRPVLATIWYELIAPRLKSAK